MLKYKVSLQGIQAFIAGASRVDDMARIALESAIQTAGELIVNTAKSPGYVPVKTGKLRDSITATYNLKAPAAIHPTVVVGPDMRIAPYAEFVEFGHFLRNGESWPGAHYMYRAYKDNKEKIADIVKVNLQGALKYYGQGIGGARHLRTGRFVGGTP